MIYLDGPTALGAGKLCPVGILSATLGKLSLLKIELLTAQILVGLFLRFIPWRTTMP